MRPEEGSRVLARIDRQFFASFTGVDVKRRFPREVFHSLFTRGILQDIGTSDSIPLCICGRNRPNCMVMVECDENRVYWGYCNDVGEPIEVPGDLVRRYAFDWKQWVKNVRTTNNLGGSSPSLGKGCLSVGVGQVGGHDYQLAFVAPGCSATDDVILPSECWKNGASLLMILLGKQYFEYPNATTLQVDDVLRDDLITLDTESIERAIVDAPFSIQNKDLVYRVFSNDHPNGKPITEAECMLLRKSSSRDRYDLFVDLLVYKIWRKGRGCVNELNGNGLSTKRKLGSKSINLIAYYIKRPHHPMAPHQTPCYQDSSKEGRSASVRFASVRRSIRGAKIFPLAAKGQGVSESTYSFEPGDIKYCLVERLA